MTKLIETLNIFANRKYILRNTNYILTKAQAGLSTLVSYIIFHLVPKRMLSTPENKIAVCKETVGFKNWNKKLQCA